MKISENIHLRFLYVMENDYIYYVNKQQYNYEYTINQLQKPADTRSIILLSLLSRDRRDIKLRYLQRSSWRDGYIYNSCRNNDILFNNP